MTCPNYGGIEPMALGKNSGCVDHEHLNYFNISSFRILANRAGFKDIEISTPGSLDLDLMSNAFKEKKTNKRVLGEFLSSIILKNEKKSHSVFQKFISEYKLSSSMLIIARNLN